MTTAHQYAKDNVGRFLEEYLNLVRIPSISTLDDYAKDVRRAAQWLAGKDPGLYTVPDALGIE